MSCENREYLIGKYQADVAVNGGSQTIFLELMANGQGAWSSEEDNVPFKWESKENEVWLHTKSGGLIMAKVAGETIEINVPSLGEYHFKKVKR